MSNEKVCMIGQIISLGKYPRLLYAGKSRKKSVKRGRKQGFIQGKWKRAEPNKHTKSTHTAFHLKRLWGGGAGGSMSSASMKIYLRPVSLHCETVIFRMRFPRLPSNHCPRKQSYQWSQDQPPPSWDSQGNGSSHQSGSGQYRFFSGARHNQTVGCHQGSRNVNSKAANIFHLGFSFVMLKKKRGRKSPWQWMLLNLQGRQKCEAPRIKIMRTIVSPHSSTHAHTHHID